MTTMTMTRKRWLTLELALILATKPLNLTREIPNNLWSSRQMQEARGVMKF